MFRPQSVIQESGGTAVQCKSCKSVQKLKCHAEINIHPPGGIENLTRPTVWAFPQLRVCSDCGFTEFVLGEPELQRLRDICSTEPSKDSLAPTFDVRGSEHPR